MAAGDSKTLAFPIGGIIVIGGILAIRAVLGRLLGSWTGRHVPIGR